MEQEIKTELMKKLNPKHVKTRPDSGMSYVEGWRVEDEANAIFKFEWDSEILSMIENTPPTQNKKSNWVVSFRATVRVTAGGQFKDGCGFGSGIAFDIHKAYEGAVKEAETDAEKRAFKKFGNRFGLALYDKLQEGVGVDEPEPNPRIDELYNKLTKDMLDIKDGAKFKTWWGVDSKAERAELKELCMEKNNALVKSMNIQAAKFAPASPSGL